MHKKIQPETTGTVLSMGREVLIKNECDVYQEIDLLVYLKQLNSLGLDINNNLINQITLKYNG